MSDFAKMFSPLITEICVMSKIFFPPHCLTFFILPHLKSKKKKKTDFIPYRDSVLTWLLRENLGMSHSLLIRNATTEGKKATICILSFMKSV